MRRVLMAMAAAGSLTGPALGAETRNFDLETTADLVALCSCPPDDPLYAQALQFCYGYLAGMAHLHRALVEDGKIERLACPSHEVAREELAGLFLDWVRDNPAALDTPAVESVKRAAVAAWPCSP
jgi:hypothetical protein